jgi:hypothetical protein
VVWFVFLREAFWIGTDADAVKVRNAERRPRISLALEDGSAPVVAEGDAVAHRGWFPEDVTEAFAAKYNGWDVTAAYRPGRARVLLEVPVSRWLLAGKAQ